MKKVLYGTTALVAGVAFAGAAHAQAIELSVGGKQEIFFGVGDTNDDRANGATWANTGMAADTELYFSGSTTLDNGLTVSAHIQLDAEQAAINNDDTHITVAGNFGRFRVGETDNIAAGQLHGAPNVGLISDEEYWAWSPGANFAGDNVDNGNTLSAAYVTPSFFGFSAGVAYAPDLANAENFVNWNAAGGPKDLIQASIAYNGEFSGVGLGASFGYSRAWAAGTAEDVNAYDAGAELSYMGFTVGGAFSLVDRFNSYVGSVGNSSIYWEAGVGYENGPYGVAFVFQDSYTEQAGDTWGLQFNGNYTVAPGIDIAASVFHTQADVDFAGREQDVNTTGGLMGIGLSF